MGSPRNHPDTKPSGSFKDPVVVAGCAEVEHCRRPTAEQLGDAELGSRQNPVTIERRLVWKRSSFEPVKQLEPVGLVPEK